MRRAFFPIFLLFASGLPAILFAEEVTTKSGLRYEVLQEGKGQTAKVGDTVRIHEIVRLSDGTVVFTTREKNAPVKFTLGAKQAIDGMDEGVTGMRVGEVRKVIVPPALSKRKSYPPNIPPDATLTIDVELVEIVGR